MMAEVFKSTDAGLAHTLHHRWGHYGISAQYSVQVLDQTQRGSLRETESLFEFIYRTIVAYMTAFV